MIAVVVQLNQYPGKVNIQQATYNLLVLYARYCQRTVVSLM